MSFNDIESVNAIAAAATSVMDGFFSGIGKLVETSQKGEVALAETLGAEAYVELKKAEGEHAAVAASEVTASFTTVSGQFFDTVRAMAPVVAEVAQTEKGFRATKDALEARRVALLENLAEGMEVEQVDVGSYSTDFRLRHKTAAETLEAAKEAAAETVRRMRSSSLMGGSSIYDDDDSDDEVPDNGAEDSRW